jgi:hypothetical protein
MRRLHILLVSLGILTTTTCLLGLWSFHRVSYDLDVDYASDAREQYEVEYEDDYEKQAEEGQEQGQGERKSKWTKVLGGTEGFYVFENVWIRDRVVCESSIFLHVTSYICSTCLCNRETFGPANLIIPMLTCPCLPRCVHQI